MQAPQLSRKDQFYRLTGRITIGVLSLCLALGTVGLGLGWLFSLNDYYYMNIHPSPSGHMRAARISRFGGAFTTQCTESIAVAPETVTEPELMTEKFDVYSSDDCDTFADHSQSPTVEWVSEEILRISFSINGTAASMRTVQLRKQDMSGRTGIEFRAHR
jgi:hypothetical protein